MKIAIVGPQNTGKSTFLADLLKAYPEYTTPTETYRDVVIRKGLRINQETGVESQRAIRDFLYRQTKENTSEHIFFDRTVIDNYVYTALAVERGAVSRDLKAETYTMMLDSFRYLDRLFFIPTAVSVALHDDLLRDTDTTFIDETNRCFIETLLDIVHQSPIAVDVISGDREARVALAHKIMGQG